MSIKHFAIIPVVGMLLLTITGCDINSSATGKQQQEADSLINVAYETKNYDRIAMLPTTSGAPNDSSRSMVSTTRCRPFRSGC